MSEIFHLHKDIFRSLWSFDLAKSDQDSLWKLLQQLPLTHTSIIVSQVSITSLLSKLKAFRLSSNQRLTFSDKLANEGTLTVC